MQKFENVTGSEEKGKVDTAESFQIMNSYTDER